MKREFTDETDKKIKLIVIYILFALTASISVLLFDNRNFEASIMTFRPSLNGAMEAVAFLVAWLLFGIIMGYMKKESFMKFLFIYWGIGGLICLMGIMASTTRLSVLSLLTIPVNILFLTPTYGLGYYYRDISFLPHQYFIVSIVSSWSSGAIGYLLGYSTKIIKDITLLNK